MNLKAYKKHKCKNQSTWFLMLELSFTLVEALFKYWSACIPSPTSFKVIKDLHLINIKCHYNHEERKIKLITWKQQNITKIENTTNSKQWHLQHFMMINCLLFWHFPSFQNIIALHPLGHIFIKTFT
jgi:uncharacterized membrane protein